MVSASYTLISLVLCTSRCEELQVEVNLAGQLPISGFDACGDVPIDLDEEGCIGLFLIQSRARLTKARSAPAEDKLRARQILPPNVLPGVALNGSDHDDHDNEDYDDDNDDVTLTAASPGDLLPTNSTNPTITLPHRAPDDKYSFGVRAVCLALLITLFYCVSRCFLDYILGLSRIDESPQTRSEKYQGANSLRTQSATVSLTDTVDRTAYHGHGHSHGRHPFAIPCDRGDEGTGTPTSRSMSKDLLGHSLDWLRTHDPAECESPAHIAADCEQARCDHSQLNFTTNVIVTVRANELIAMSHMNSMLALTSVLYVASMIVCMLLNSYNCNPVEERFHRTCSTAATSDEVFHRLEFWSTFIFTTVDVFALSYSPKNISNQYGIPTLLKVVVLFSVGITFTTSLLVTVNLHKFDTLSHELEYMNEFTMTIFDATILLNLVRGRSHQSALQQWMSIFSLVVSACVAIVQLCIYNFSGWTRDGQSGGEKPAHYMEFGFGLISAVITFWFCMDNKLSADQRLNQIMHGPPEALQQMSPFNS